MSVFRAAFLTEIYFSDDDTVKILPTDEDLDWFAKKRLASKQSAGLFI